MRTKHKDIASGAASLRKTMTRLQQVYVDLKYEVLMWTAVTNASKERRSDIKRLLKSLKKEVKLSYKHIKAIEKAEAERSEWEKKK